MEGRDVKPNIPQASPRPILSSPHIQPMSCQGLPCCRARSWWFSISRSSWTTLERSIGSRAAARGVRPLSAGISWSNHAVKCRWSICPVRRVSISGRTSAGRASAWARQPDSPSFYSCRGNRRVRRVVLSPTMSRARRNSVRGRRAVMRHSTGTPPATSCRTASATSGGVWW